MLRASAALTVFLHHANWLGLDAGLLFPFRREVGHSAVVIFFVLSGFVIAASMVRTWSATDYAIKRVSRIYSVAIPALLLTLALDLLAVKLGLQVSLADYELRKPWLYLALHLAFAGDLWSLGISAFSDNPYWSLNYEVWYYVAFGAASFLRGGWRLLGLGLVLLVMGPKLLLLLPIWLGGVAVYAVSQRTLLPRAVARVVAVGAVVLFLVFMGLHLDETVAAAGLRASGAVVPFPLRFSQWFASDYVIGVLTMALVWALCSAEVPVPSWLAWGGTKLAAVSFSLYLVHFPIMQFLGALMPGYGLVAVALTLVLATGFGLVFEPQRDRLRRILVAATPAALARPK